MPCPFVHLSLKERRQLARLRESKLSVTEIARALGRHRSTIYREIRRNWWHDAEVPQAEGYWPAPAQQLAEGRRRSLGKLARHPDLRAAVIDRLKDGRSHLADSSYGPHDTHAVGPGPGERLELV